MKYVKIISPPILTQPPGNVWMIYVCLIACVEKCNSRLLNRELYRWGGGGACVCMSMDPIPRIFGETANVIFCTCVSAHMPFQLRLKGKLMCVLTITRFIVVAPFGKIFLKVPPPCQLYCSVVQLPHIPCSLGIAHKYMVHPLHLLLCYVPFFYCFAIIITEDGKGLQ